MPRDGYMTPLRIPTYVSFGGWTVKAETLLKTVPFSELVISTSHCGPGQPCWRLVSRLNGMIVLHSLLTSLLTTSTSPTSSTTTSP